MTGMNAEGIPKPGIRQGLCKVLRAIQEKSLKATFAVASDAMTALIDRVRMNATCEIFSRFGLDLIQVPHIAVPQTDVLSHPFWGCCTSWPTRFMKSAALREA